MGIRILDDFLIHGVAGSGPLDPPRAARVRGGVALEGRTGLTVARDRRVREVRENFNPRGGAGVAWLQWRAQVERGLIPVG